MSAVPFASTKNVTVVGVMPAGFRSDRKTAPASMALRISGSRSN